MIRSKNNWLTSLAVTIGCVIPAALTTGCGSAPEASPSEDAAESAATLGVQVDTCSLASAAGYNTMSSTLALTMGTVHSLVLGVVNGYVTVNGYACVKPTAAGGAKLTPAMVKKITIAGTTGDDKVVIDTLSGALGATILSATGGITVDLGADTADDTFSIRGSSAIDKWTAGVAGGDVYFEISGDTTADIRVQNTELYNVSLSAGNDTFTAMGGAFNGTHLVAMGTVTALTPMTLAMNINGGDGDDVLTGGGGNDIISGGNGNDTFKASTLVAMTFTSDGNDTFNGGAGTDKADYSARTAALTIVMDNTTASGDLGNSEADIINSDVEDLIGGTGADTLTGNTLANHIQGGAGNDTISGGAGGTCTADVDVLDGEADNDVFLMGGSANCGDTVNGGAGTDRADYQARGALVALNVSLDGTANDGDPAAGMTGEKDNVKNDVEIVIGGSGNDTIVGSANNDELHGGPGNDVISGGAGNDTISGDSGNDTLNGEAGDDTFDESGVDPEYTVAENKGDGDDIMNGGTHDSLGLDTASYAARGAMAPVTVTLCQDPAKLTGNSGLSMVTACTDNDGDPAATEHDKVVNVNHLVGGLGDDTLTGHTGDDIIEGGAGADTLAGGAGNDTLFGDDGVDTMYGDAGDDYLDGDDSDSDSDVFDGDHTSNDSDADVCITATGETPTNCEL
ncbi:MAG TPA: calcium-binding protein [Polyangiaceae bacterium]|nr:calcium-binding protein [Polyangiaceae bacterium]